MYRCSAEMHHLLQVGSSIMGIFGKHRAPDDPNDRRRQPTASEQRELERLRAKLEQEGKVKPQHQDRHGKK